MSKFLKWFTLSKSVPSFSSMALVTDKQNVGKKSSKRKRSNMSKLPVVEVCKIINTSPEVAEKMMPWLGSHNKKESRQCPQHLLNGFNLFSVQHRNALMGNLVREPVLQSALVFSVRFINYQSPLFQTCKQPKHQRRLF